MLVGPSRKCYSVPGALLSHYSAIFDRKLHDFSDGGFAPVMLPEETPEVFEQILQWIYKNSITLPTTLTSANKIQAFVNFYLAANKYELLGPYTSVHTKFKELLISGWSGILKDLDKQRFVFKVLESVFQLPAHHPARTLLVQACVRPYMDFKRWTIQPTITIC